MLKKEQEDELSYQLQLLAEAIKEFTKAVRRDSSADIRAWVIGCAIGSVISSVITYFLEKMPG